MNAALVSVRNFIKTKLTDPKALRVVYLHHGAAL